MSSPVLTGWADFCQRCFLLLFWVDVSLLGDAGKPIRTDVATVGDFLLPWLSERTLGHRAPSSHLGFAVCIVPWTIETRSRHCLGRKRCRRCGAYRNVARKAENGGHWDRSLLSRSSSKQGSERTDSCHPSSTDSLFQWLSNRYTPIQRACPNSSERLGVPRYSIPNFVPILVQPFGITVSP